MSYHQKLGFLMWLSHLALRNPMKALVSIVALVYFVGRGILAAVGV